MDPLEVCLNTQTPLLQFPAGTEGSPPRWKNDGNFAHFREDVDYRFSPGGVTRMVYPLAKRLLENGTWRGVHWVSLNPNAPASLAIPGMTLHNVAIDRERMGGYGKAKEAIWATVHGLREPKLSGGLFWTDDYGEYTYYNRTTAELIRRLDLEFDFDVFYIHDFQQLPMGHMLATLKTKIFRWHIPFDAENIPRPWRSLLSTYLNAYDVIVVSSDTYRDSLQRFGYRGRVERIYPYVDPNEYTRPGAEEVAAVVERFPLRPDDDVALVVARMDPQKAQDRAIASVARLARRFPHLRLVLAGNGSFSSSREGLGLSKSDTWHSHLEEIARELGVSDRVVFTGHVTQRELDALYERCSFTLLPSVKEGFGLVVVESWLHRKPTLVTARAGVAELIKDGENGLLFDPDDPAALDRQMRRLLRDPSGLRDRLIEGGAKTARRCTIENALKAESRLFGKLVEA